MGELAGCYDLYVRCDACADEYRTEGRPQSRSAAIREARAVGWGVMTDGRMGATVRIVAVLCPACRGKSQRGGPR